MCRYIEEHVLKTGVAIETQGFAFITSGKKRESLTVSSSSDMPQLKHHYIPDMSIVMLLYAFYVYIEDSFTV